MIRRRIASLGLVAAGIVLLTSITPSWAATAQPTSSTNGISNALKVSPVRSDADINPGMSKTFDVYIQNLSNTTARFHTIINDFVANKDESGSPSIILDPTQSAPTHSLKAFVTPIADLTLQPNEQKDVKVTVTIPKTASAGGYYGVVRFEPASGSGDQSLTLSASVGSLILVRVPGAIKENLTIASFDVRKDNQAKTVFTSGKKLQAVVRFQNQGDVQEEPFGKVLVRKGGKILASYDINTTNPRGNVLPDSIRRFSIDLSNVDSFGKYSIEGNFGYGSKGQLLTTAKTIYIIPVGVIVVMALALVVILFVIFALPKLIKGYNRRVVNKALSKKK